MELENKKKTIKIGGLLTLVFLIIYVPAFLYWVYGDSIDTGIIRNGTIEDAINTDGYLVRDEEVLKSPLAGRCITEVEEGDKVPSNFKVATILKESSQSLYEDLKQNDLKILSAQKKKDANMEVFSGDIEKIDNEIKLKMKLLIEENNRNSLVKAKDLKDEINELVQKKASIFGNSSISDAYIESLKKQKTTLQEKIKANTREIITKYPGIVSYEVDGHETELRPEAIKEITPTYINNLHVKTTQRYGNNFLVEAEKPFAKVIKDFEGFLIIVIDTQKARHYSIDDNIFIRINDINKVINGVVYYKSIEENGKMILAVKIDKAVSETAGLRKVDIDLIKTSIAGLKIPLSSLRDINLKTMTAKIVLVKGNAATLCDVKIVGKNDDSAIIENIGAGKYKSGVGLYNIYVQNPGNIQEGQMIN